MPTTSGYCYRGSGTIRAFPSLWHLCLVRTECEDATAAWVVGTLTAPMCQEHGLPWPQELWPYYSLFLDSGSWQSEGLSV